MVKKIPLTQGQHALVDDEDYEFLNQFKWCAHKAPGYDVYYAVRTHCCEIKDGKRINKRIAMHRLIMDAPKGLEVDHINRVGTDNRKSNLRIVTRRQNSHNTPKRGTSKYKGVWWNKSAKKWQSQTQINNKIIRIGFFDSEKEAFEAYKKTINELAGEKLLCELETAKGGESK